MVLPPDYGHSRSAQVAGAYSKTWSCREDALLALYRKLMEMPAGTPKEDAKNMLRASVFLIRRAIKDIVTSVSPHLLAQAPATLREPGALRAAQCGVQPPAPAPGEPRPRASNVGAACACSPSATSRPCVQLGLCRGLASRPVAATVSCGLSLSLACASAAAARTPPRTRTAEHGSQPGSLPPHGVIFSRVSSSDPHTCPPWPLACTAHSASAPRSSTPV